MNAEKGLKINETCSVKKSKIELSRLKMGKVEWIRCLYCNKEEQDYDKFRKIKRNKRLAKSLAA